VSLRGVTAGLALFLVGCSVATQPEPNTSAPIIFLDADTANEMDDLYAITQVVADPHISMSHLSSSHFNNVEIGTKGRWHAYDVEGLGYGLDTVGASQIENEKLLATLGQGDLPAPLGTSEMLGFSWGYYDGAPVPNAPAVQAMIAAGRAASSENKANLVALGPLTNVAAALIHAPEITPNVTIWWLGSGYENGVWNKNRFNVRNDLNAADYILDRQEIDLVMMPTQTARKLMFQRATTIPQLEAISHPVAQDLIDRWDFVSAEGAWTMWDMALTLAIAHPEWATLETVAAPPENARETVRVYTDINAPAMEAHFFEILLVP
jgi:inosine-uridine nucleoside N-ribohydrolase